MSEQLEQVRFDEKRTTATLLVDKKIYAKAAVLKAAYWLSGDLYFQIEEQQDHFQITASLSSPNPTLAQPKPKTIDELLPTFFQTLLDSQLRSEIQSETASVRELIIAKAFAESGVLEDPPPGTFEDPVALSRSSKLVEISGAENK